MYDVQMIKITQAAKNKAGADALKLRMQKYRILPGSMVHVRATAL